MLLRACISQASWDRVPAVGVRPAMNEHLPHPPPRIPLPTRRRVATATSTQAVFNLAPAVGARPAKSESLSHPLYPIPPQRVAAASSTTTRSCKQSSPKSSFQLKISQCWTCLQHLAVQMSGC
eukprot:1239109-Rhodomonas_salina.1